MTGKNAYCTFYIIRHGETDWNAKKLLQGQTDIPLNEKGKQQALSLGKLLVNIRFDAAFSSDLLRAKQTAEILAIEKKITVQTTKLLRERRFGKLEGQSWEKADSRLESLIHRLVFMTEEEKRKHGLERAENNEDLIARLIPFLRELCIAYAGKTVLIATHGGLMRAFLIHLGFGTHETLRSGAISNTGYVKIESDGVDFFVKETMGVKKSA